MDFIKLILFFILSNVNLFLFGQVEYEALINKTQPKLRIFQSYFSHKRLDSAFAQKHSIKSISVTEAKSIGDSLVYDKPIIVYHYARTGKRTHIENNSWSGLGGTRRYHDYYEDSVITGQHEHHVYSDSTTTDYRSISKRYIINDTLSRTIKYRYYFDSLLSKKDMGIYDSRALARKRATEKAYRLANPTINNGMEINTVNVTPKNVRSCYGSSIFHMEDSPPTATKDSLNRVIELHFKTYRQINGKYYNVPHKTLLLNYYKNTTLLKSCISYYHYDIEQFEAQIMANNTNEKTKFTINFDPEKINYSFIAENFKAPGLPLKVTIDNGYDLKKYTVQVEFW